MDPRITSFVNRLFQDLPRTAAVTEQKEELASNLAERIADCMAGGMDFEAAFGAAKAALGDTDELMRQLGKKSGGIKGGKRRRKRREAWRPRPSFFGHQLTALAPFAYVLLGIFVFRSWQWWAAGWLIIPITPLVIEFLKHPSPKMLIPLSPFIYVLLGLFVFRSWQWWAAGWVIIPVSGILFGNVTVTYDDEDEDTGDKTNIGQVIRGHVAEAVEKNRTLEERIAEDREKRDREN